MPITITPSWLSTSRLHPGLFSNIYVTEEEKAFLEVCFIITSRFRIMEEMKCECTFRWHQCVYDSVSRFCPPVPMLEHLCSALLYPDEALKASVLYVWLKLFGTAGGSVAQSLPMAIRDRVCVLLLQTLANAASPQLINNCIGEKNICQLYTFVYFLLPHISTCTDDARFCETNSNI